MKRLLSQEVKLLKGTYDVFYHPLLLKLRPLNIVDLNCGAPFKAFRKCNIKTIICVYKNITSIHTANDRIVERAVSKISK